MWRSVLHWGLCVAGCAWASLCPASDPSGPLDEQELGIPAAAPVRRGEGRRVEFQARDGSTKVALLHAEIGDRRLIILPNGRLESRSVAETRLTESPFKAATKDQIAADLRATRFARFKTRSTVRYVYAYNTSDEFFRGASRILESMYPAILNYFKRQKFPVHDPATPLVAILFRTEQEFRDYGQVPEGVAAYYNTISNEIVMYEQSKLFDAAPELALKHAIGTIAHEGTHQILHNIGVQERLSRWPAWTCEGLAEYFAPTSVNEQSKWKGIGSPHDLRMYELQAHLERGVHDPGALIRGTVDGVQLKSTGYAASWAIVHYLATRQPDKFAAYLREIAAYGPLEPRDPSAAAPAQRAAFEKYFGSDYEGLESALWKHLEGLPYVDPVANQTHYVATLHTPQMRSASLTTSPSAAERWGEKAAAQLDPAILGQSAFEIIPFANKALAEEYMKLWLGK